MRSPHSPCAPCSPSLAPLAPASPNFEPHPLPSSLPFRPRPSVSPPLPSPFSSSCFTAYKTTLECKEGWLVGRRFGGHVARSLAWTDRRTDGRTRTDRTVPLHNRRSRFVGVGVCARVRPSFLIIARLPGTRPHERRGETRE